jgi:hypothetical protein
MCWLQAFKQNKYPPQQHAFGSSNSSHSPAALGWACWQTGSTPASKPLLVLYDYATLNLLILEGNTLPPPPPTSIIGSTCPQQHSSACTPATKDFRLFRDPHTLLYTHLPRAHLLSCVRGVNAKHPCGPFFCHTSTYSS